MPVRIMSYMALLWQDLIRTGVIAATDSLPGIIPVVLYHGEVPWTVPANIQHTILMPEPMLCFRPSVPYLVIDELRLSVHHLIEVRNLAACLFGLEQSSDSTDLFNLGLKLNQWMEKNPAFHSLRRDFLIFFREIIKER